MLGCFGEAGWLLLRNARGSKEVFAVQKPNDESESGSGMGKLRRNPGFCRAKTYTLKLSPHEQLALALGFENLNPPDTMALE